MIGQLAVGSLEPVLRRRGLAQADLLRFWPDVVGEAFADGTVPERIAWPRRDGSGARGRLVVRCDPSLALALEYQREQVIERVNAFLGHAAIDRLQIRQVPIRRMRSSREAAPAVLSESEERALAHRLSSVDDGLRDSLMALGRAVALRRRSGQ